MLGSKNCPKCRSTLMKNHSQDLVCKRCGFQKKTIKVAEAQEQFFNRTNHSGRIYIMAQREAKSTIVPSSQRLKLYLLNFQKILRTALQTFFEQTRLSILEKKQFQEETRNVWLNYLGKMSIGGKCISGMFRRSIFQHQSGLIENEQCKDEQKNEGQQIEVKQAPKRRGKQKTKDEQILCKQNSEQKVETIESAINKFRSYFNSTVKASIIQSIPQESEDVMALTISQKIFLSYIASIDGGQMNQKLIRLVSSKYYKMLIKNKRSKQYKSYIKQKELESLLESRGQRGFSNKDKSLAFLLLLDLLLFWRNSSDTLLPQNASFRNFLEDYELSTQKNSCINAILAYLIDQKSQTQNYQIPQPSYSLIYSLIYVVSAIRKYPFTISEIIGFVGHLRIDQIDLTQEFGQLPRVANEEAINVEKIRRISHLLTSFLGLQIPIFPNLWSLKWCQKLELLQFCTQVSFINSILLQPSSISIKRYEKFFFAQKQGKSESYDRHIGLEQDIACLAGILIFFKLRVGLSDYPYILQMNPNLLEQKYELIENHAKFFRQIINKKEINIRNNKTEVAITSIMPQKYVDSLDFLATIDKINLLYEKDDYFGVNSLNEKGIRLRILGDLQGAGATSLNKLLEIRNQYNKSKKMKKNQQDILLRFNDRAYTQTGFLRDQNFHKLKRIEEAIKWKDIEKVLGAKLNENLLRQLFCIVNPQISNLQLERSENVEVCLLDEPSTNYQMIGNYSWETLIQTNREQFLLLMDRLCLNICQFRDLGGWLTKYQSALKEYQ